MIRAGKCSQETKKRATSRRNREIEHRGAGETPQDDIKKLMENQDGRHPAKRRAAAGYTTTAISK